MKCQKCQDEGLRSRLFVKQVDSPATSVQVYYDENGKLHQHDPVGMSTDYRCSNGHSWTAYATPFCFNCSE